MRVALPAALRHGPVAAFVDRRRVRAERVRILRPGATRAGAGAELRFVLRARGGRAVNWAVARP
jgi:hypothetical protein